MDFFGYYIGSFLKNKYYNAVTGAGGFWPSPSPEEFANRSEKSLMVL